ncbi:MAG TPA: hypothetical protein VJ915_00285, partial [Balneolaceae bacterium]|nr:hypothetical protein [Balneolaceae bacterium]
MSIPQLTKSLFSKTLFLLSLILLSVPAATYASSVTFTMPVFAQALPQIDLSIGGEAEDFSTAIQALILVTVLSFGPAFVTMMTSF